MPCPTDVILYLVLDARLVETVAADGARVGADVPRPHRHGIPLLDLESRSHLQQWHRIVSHGITQHFSRRKMKDHSGGMKARLTHETGCS